MNGEVNKFKAKVKAQAPETYYEITQGRYFIEDANGNWLPVNETQYKRVLKHRGLSNSVEQGEFVSPIDKAILNVQQTRNIHFAGPLAGYPKGYYDFDQHRVLVTESPRLIKPEEGFWNTLMKVIGGLLDDGVQLPYFYGWLKVAVTSLRTGNWLPGQVMVFCGPHGGGKSLLQQLVTLILGGRVARPYQFMMGSTSFNADIFGAEHLAIEDEAPSTDMRSRRSFGSQIKGITVCSAQRMHAKHCTPIILHPFWRISLSINDEPENVQVLPPIDDSLTDKIILLKARRVEMPMPTSTPSQRKLFWDTLVSELPAFLAFLDRWEIPADLVSQRFGVKEYHHPEILALLDDVAPEFRLLALIDQVLFTQHLSLTESFGSNTWTAEQIQSSLTDASAPCSFEARRLLSWNNACGTYLGRLAKRRPDRVQYHRTADSRLWLLIPPPEAIPQEVKK